MVPWQGRWHAIRVLRLRAHRGAPKVLATFGETELQVRTGSALNQKLYNRHRPKAPKQHSQK
eukprot:3567924-Amphidinium_carterae.1